MARIQGVAEISGSPSKLLFTLIEVKMAGDIGFEPMHDGVKVRCLTAWLIPNNYHVTSMSNSRLKHEWWRLRGSNPRPSACKADALPAELSLHVGDP